ncbi:cytochrome P450 [Fusarium oxysporum Fo47]|uniref:Uncharacterized protein n=1 Tax=Fusarium oxysporum Fo47 TaxID=660027 RepID=W9JDW3_FUSOX|nr:cytochrome P450 [Fusarium oxysporum Fo47]EWZ28664.1 hypothetical protein FOZG_17669 [Fusarium oxysporum Fo47]QKD57129.1 cytochrome P450 [Fusarium oxysporum Fo47]
MSLVPGVHSSISTVDNQVHAKLKRLISQGLSNSHIRAYDPELRQSALLFATRLGEIMDHFEPDQSDVGEDGWTVPKNLASWSNYFTFDVMSHLVFGTSYNLLTNSENHWVIDGVLGQMRRMSFLTMLPELEDMRFDLLLFPGARRMAYQFAVKSREIMEARKIREKAMEGQETKVDLFSKLLAAKDPETGEGLPDKQLWAESNVMIIAGSDTSSTAIAATLFYLSRNPSAYARVTKEVRSTITTPPRHLPGSKTALVHISPCLYSRVNMPQPAGWRGCEIGTGIYAVHHNEEYYHDPLEFRPERWLADEVGDEAVAKAHSAFDAFSQGPRGCPGKSLALIEIPFALAAVIIGYDFRKVESSLGEVGEEKGKFAGQYQTSWAFSSLKDGPYLPFKRIKS